MILIRYFLIFIVGFLIIRLLLNFSREEENSLSGKDHEDNKVRQKKVSKKIGEYVDYEEIKEKKK